MLITVVRSLVGQTIDLGEGKSIRPWASIELTDLSPEMRALLIQLRTDRHVTIAQVKNNIPLDAEMV